MSMTLWCHEPCVFVLARGVDNQRRTMVPEPSSASPRVIAIFRVDPPTAKPSSGSSATSILEDELLRAVISFQAAAAASIQNQRTSPQLIKHERPSCCSHTLTSRWRRRLVSALLSASSAPCSTASPDCQTLCRATWSARSPLPPRLSARPAALAPRHGPSPVLEGPATTFAICRRHGLHRPAATPSTDSADACSVGGAYVKGHDCAPPHTAPVSLPRQCGLDRALRLR